MKVTVVNRFPANPENGVLYCRKRGKDFSTEGFVQTSHSLGKITLCERKVYLLQENGKAYEYISSGGQLFKKAV